MVSKLAQTVRPHGIFARDLVMRGLQLASPCYACAEWSGVAELRLSSHRFVQMIGHGDRLVGTQVMEESWASRFFEVETRRN